MTKKRKKNTYSWSRRHLFLVKFFKFLSIFFVFFSFSQFHFFFLFFSHLFLLFSSSISHILNSFIKWLIEFKIEKTNFESTKYAYFRSRFIFFHFQNFYSFSQLDQRDFFFLDFFSIFSRFFLIFFSFSCVVETFSRNRVSNNVF